MIRPGTGKPPRLRLDEQRVAETLGTLLLINHWIATEPVLLLSQAAKVNAYGPLVARVRECERIRRHVASLVAVNFYRHGDLFRAVDTLNGLR